MKLSTVQERFTSPTHHDTRPLQHPIGKGLNSCDRRSPEGRKRGSCQFQAVEMALEKGA